MFCPSFLVPASLGYDIEIDSRRQLLEKVLEALARWSPFTFFSSCSDDPLGSGKAKWTCHRGQLTTAAHKQVNFLKKIITLSHSAQRWKDWL
jgi:hypothetical protein